MKINIGKVIDFLTTNMGRGKTISIVALLILFSLTLIKHGADQDQIEKMVEQVTGLKLANEVLMGSTEVKDSAFAENEKRIQELVDRLARAEGNYLELQKEHTQLQESYNNLSDSINEIPTDTSYKFLTTEAYPYDGHRRYPFNGPQVKGIHLTYIEREKLADINKHLEVELDAIEGQLDYKDTIVAEQEAAILSMKSIRQDQDSIISNQDDIIVIQKEQIKKERFGKRVWQMLLGAFTIIFTALALS